jgi:hypothetical protein
MEEAKMVVMNRKIYFVWVLAIFAAMCSPLFSEVIQPLNSDIYDNGSDQATFENADSGDSPVPAGWSSVGVAGLRVYRDNSTMNAALIAAPGFHWQDYTAQFVTSTPAAANKEYSLSMLIGDYATDSKDCKVTVTFGTVDDSNVFTPFGLPYGPKLIDFDGSNTNIGSYGGTYTTFKTISGPTVADGNVAVQIFVDNTGPGLGAYWPGIDSLLLEQNEISGPIISSNPESVLVGQGTNASFVIKGLNISSYHWYKGTTALTNGGNISGADTNTLTISNASVSDEAAYHCQISNGGTTLESETATLVTKKLAIHLKFDGNAQDSSGLSNNGTVVGTVAYTTGADGKANGALQLNNSSGTSNYIRLINPVASQGIDPSLADIIANTNSFTISCWIKPSFVQGYEMYVSSGSPSTGWYMSRQAASNTQARFYIDESGVIPTTGPLGDGNWHMFTAIVDVDAKIASIYLDCAKQGEGVAAPGPGRDFLIGALNWAKYPSLSIDCGYTGSIDDVQYYNYAISTNELYQMYYDMTGTPFCDNGALLDGDFNKDCKVDFNDLLVVVGDWLECNLYPASVCNQ